IAEGGYLQLFLLYLLSVAVAVAIGWFWGGWDKTIAIWVSIGTATAFALAAATDQLLRGWSGYLERQPRPVSTIGSGTPGFQGPFWTVVWDWGTQLILPTIVLTIISLASYSRYTRSSMLET